MLIESSLRKKEVVECYVKAVMKDVYGGAVSGGSGR